MKKVELIKLPIILKKYLKEKDWKWILIMNIL
jgi:hypothetical protein